MKTYVLIGVSAVLWRGQCWGGGGGGAGGGGDRVVTKGSNYTGVLHHNALLELAMLYVWNHVACHASGTSSSEI